MPIQGIVDICGSPKCKVSPAHSQAGTELSRRKTSHLYPFAYSQSAQDRPVEFARKRESTEMQTEPSHTMGNTIACYALHRPMGLPGTVGTGTVWVQFEIMGLMHVP